MKLTKEDRALLVECFKEAERLRKQLREINDAKLAEKFGVSKQYVNKYHHKTVGMFKGYRDDRP